MEWRSILCQTGMTGTRFSQIQQALETAGYNPGPIDASIGAQTMSAVNTFQRDKGLGLIALRLMNKRLRQQDFDHAPRPSPFFRRFQKAL